MCDRTFGWQKGLPDFRDLSHESTQVKSILNQSQPFQKATTALPAAVDLRSSCSPIVDQGQLGSCTANAGAGLIEYFEKKAFNKFTNVSRLFLYKATRDLMNSKGDSGADLRSTMKAIAMFGTPPESYWPYVISKFDTEPSAFLYAMSQNYKAMTYFKLDPTGTALPQVLTNVKTNLAAGLPSMFGFTVYSSFPMTTTTGDIPYPSSKESVLGGHAIVAVGYSDTHTIGGNVGALLIRNSWGTSWGMQGYGWLPYKYVTSGIASDFWTLVQSNFIDTDLFK
jgi:C1A family cysteine protease